MADGIMQDVQEALRQTLADCHAWQTWQDNAWTREEALARIHHDALPPPATEENHTLSELQELRPFILVYTETDGGFVMRRDADGYGYDQRGSLIICIEQDIPEDILTDLAEIDLRFRKDLGNLLKSGNAAEPGLAELADQPGKFVVREARVRGPVRTEEEDVRSLGESQRCWLEIDWGPI